MIGEGPAATRHAVRLLVQRSRFLSLRELDPGFATLQNQPEPTRADSAVGSAVELVLLGHSVLDDLCRVAELEARRCVRMHADCCARVDFSWLLESQFASVAQLHAGVVDAVAEGAGALAGAGLRSKRYFYTRYIRFIQ